MAAVLLSKVLKEGQGLTDDSNGGVATLFDVLTALASATGQLHEAEAASPAVATISSKHSAIAGAIRAFAIELDTTGGSGATTVELRVETVVVATLVIDNTDPNGTTKAISIKADVNKFDLIEIVVTTIASGPAASNLTAVTFVQAVVVE